MDAGKLRSKLQGDTTSHPQRNGYNQRLRHHGLARMWGNQHSYTAGGDEMGQCPEETASRLMVVARGWGVWGSGQKTAATADGHGVSF